MNAKGRYQVARIARGVHGINWEIWDMWTDSLVRTWWYEEAAITEARGLNALNERDSRDAAVDAAKKAEGKS